MTRPDLSLEIRQFLITPVGALVVALVVLVSLAAVLSGRAHVDRTVTAQKDFTQKSATALAEWRDALETIERAGASTSPYDAQPMNIRIPASLPPSPLGDFAIGATTLHPSMTEITPWSNSVNLFGEYEFANPTTLALGRFDLAFVAVVIIPLLMIVVSFDVLAADRESGRLRLGAAQRADRSSGVFARLLVRNGAIWAGFAATLVFALIASPSVMSADRVAHFAAWTAICLVYFSFWVAVIAAAVAWIRRGDAAAAVLAAAWALLVFALPGLTAGTADFLNPPPARLAYLSEMRAAQGAAEREADRLTEGFLRDHPTLTVSDEEVPGYFRSAFLANRETERRTAGILEDFVRSADARRAIADRAQYLSPPLIVHRALVAVAGADIDRMLAFKAEARRALGRLSDAVASAVITKRRISLAEFDRLERFQFGDAPLSRTLARFAIPIAYVLALTGLLLILARRRFRAPLERQL